MINVAILQLNLILKMSTNNTLMRLFSKRKEREKKKREVSQSNRIIAAFSIADHKRL